MPLFSSFASFLRISPVSTRGTLSQQSRVQTIQPYYAWCRVVPGDRREVSPTLKRPQIKKGRTILTFLALCAISIRFCGYADAFARILNLNRRYLHVACLSSHRKYLQIDQSNIYVS